MEFPFFAMEFDHREGEVKSFSIAEARNGIGKSRLMAEIAKCDVVCCLCHRFRTARRAGWTGLAERLPLVELSELADDS
ncbi:hypothetical protein ACN26Y_20980 [Micromonospora sp. WMMD558]|uniref:hypothetical protein n=1 Tax=Micromonospora sp. WMMD558 TaxID=3403462 RepID=UPI003BF4AB28